MTSLRIGLGLGVALLLSAPLRADTSPSEAQGKDDRLVQAGGGGRFGFPRWDNRPGGFRRPGTDDKKPDEKGDKKASPREEKKAPPPSGHAPNIEKSSERKGPPPWAPAWGARRGGESRGPAHSWRGGTAKHGHHQAA